MPSCRTCVEVTTSSTRTRRRTNVSGAPSTGLSASSDRITTLLLADRHRPQRNSAPGGHPPLEEMAAEGRWRPHVAVRRSEIPAMRGSGFIRMLTHLTGKAATGPIGFRAAGVPACTSSTLAHRSGAHRPQVQGTARRRIGNIITESERKANHWLRRMDGSGGRFPLWYLSLSISVFRRRDRCRLPPPSRGGDRASPDG
jgi:hypothetical protein